MSETEQQHDNSDEQGDDQLEQPAEQGEASSKTSENPPVEQEEMADLGSVVEDIEEASQKQQDEGDSSEDSDEDDTDNPTEREIDPNDSGISLGTVYTNALGMSAAVARGRYGDLDRDRKDVADEYAEMARQIDLDTYLDQWMRENGGLDQLSPGEAVLLGTLMWGGMVMLDDPTMAETALGEVRS